MESNWIYRMKDGRIANYDEEQDIHYGVIPVNAVLQSWADCAEPITAEPEPGEEIDEFDELPVVEWIYEGEGYALSQWADDYDIFIVKSPFFTYAEKCSPCAPNAGYIMNEGTVKTYCLGHDWFDTGHAPYKVFDVKTGQEVTP